MLEMLGGFLGAVLGVIVCVYLLPTREVEVEVEVPYEPEEPEEDPADYWKHGSEGEGDYS